MARGIFGMARGIFGMASRHLRHGIAASSAWHRGMVRGIAAWFAASRGVGPRRERRCRQGRPPGVDPMDAGLGRAPAHPRRGSRPERRSAAATAGSCGRRDAPGPRDPGARPRRPSPRGSGTQAPVRGIAAWFAASRGVAPRRGRRGHRWTLEPRTCTQAPVRGIAAWFAASRGVAPRRGRRGHRCRQGSPGPPSRAAASAGSCGCRDARAALVHADRGSTPTRLCRASTRLIHDVHGRRRRRLPPHLQAQPCAATASCSPAARPATTATTTTTCDDGINDDCYDGCYADCSALGPHCGDGLLDAAATPRRPPAPPPPTPAPPRPASRPRSTRTTTSPATGASRPPSPPSARSGRVGQSVGSVRSGLVAGVHQNNGTATARSCWSAALSVAR
jgi:hypothetical protein